MEPVGREVYWSDMGIGLRTRRAPYGAQRCVNLVASPHDIGVLLCARYGGERPQPPRRHD